MKLRNKKTGEIVDFKIHKYAELSDDGNPVYAPFDGSIEDWENYVEAKDRWYINENGGVLHYVPYDPEGEDLVYNKYQDEIGNHFETKEEAEKAVEKLKAWERLKDKGFRFNSCSVEHYVKQPRGIIAFELNDYDNKLCKDLDLLFGGKDE